VDQILFSSLSMLERDKSVNMKVKEIDDIINVFVIKADETVYFIKIKISGIICNFI